MQTLKWIERKFNFGYGPEYFPLFIERIKSTLPRIEELTKNLSEEKACFMPDGKWSVKQHIGHLTDLEELHDGRLTDFKAGEKILRAADMGNKKTEAADHNKTSIAKLIADLKTSRKNFIEQVSSFTEDELKRVSFHPRLQQNMNVLDLLHFIGEHDTFHLAIMARIVEN